MATSHKYKKRKMWKKEDMAAAITAVREKKLGYLKAAKQFNVPRSTLFRFVNDENSSIESVTNKVIGRKPIFNQDVEHMLAEIILTMKTKFYGLTRMDLRRMAYQLAQKNNLKNPFKDGFAGRYWLYGFLKRNQKILSKGQPSRTSQARVNRFTKERIDEFYGNLEKNQAEKSFPLAHLFKVNGSGLSIQSSIPKIGARKGKKQIGAMTSAERGSLIKKITKKTKKRTKSDRDLNTNKGNNTDPSNTVKVKFETAVPTDEDAECFFCYVKYRDDKRGGDWVQCLSCELWVHSVCSGYESGPYVCDFCKYSN